MKYINIKNLTNNKLNNIIYILYFKLINER